jgi:hypothetical protein
MKIVGKIIKYSITGLIIFFIGFMTLRIITSGDTKIARSFLWTDEAKASYQTSPDKFKIYSIEVSKNFTDEGKFYVSNTRYAESENGNISQIQTTIRWNNSTIKYLMADNGLTEPPAGEPFIFTLTDDIGNVYTGYEMVSDTKTLYNYRRMVFDGVDFTDVNFFYINIYYAGTYDPAAAAEIKGSDENAYGTLTIYRASNLAQEYKLKNDELPK